MPSNDNKPRENYHIVRRGHEDVPEEEWPGRPVTEEDVKLASGHKLDVFTVEERLRAYRAVESSFHRHYETRSIVPNWNFTLVLGRMGEGKSTLVSILFGVRRAQGWPVFHTGSLLFGRVLAANEVYTAVNTMPDNSALFIDEAHVFMGLAADNSRHSMMLLQSMAGLRKKNCDFILATAADDLMSRKLKREAHEVITPFRPDVAPRRDMSARGIRRRQLGLTPLGGAPRDSRLFRLGFTTIMGYPFAQDGILERYGLSPPSEDPGSHEMRQRMVHPRLVKEGLLLNDSFQQVPVGVQMTVNRQQIVDEQGDVLYGATATDQATGGLEDWQLGMWNLLNALEGRSFRERDRVTNEDITNMANVDMTPRQFGAKVRSVLGIQRSQRGYLISELLQELRTAFRTEEADGYDGG